MKIRALEKTEIKILARLLYEAIARRAYSNSVGQRPTKMATLLTARPNGALAIIAIGASPRRVYEAFQSVGQRPTLMLIGLSAQTQHSIK